MDVSSVPWPSCRMPEYCARDCETARLEEERKNVLAAANCQKRRFGEQLCFRCVCVFVCVCVSPKNGERNAIVAAIRWEMSDSVLYLIFGSEHRQDYSINLIVCHKSLGYGRVCVRSHFAGLFLLSLVTSISTHRRRAVAAKARHVFIHSIFFFGVRSFRFVFVCLFLGNSNR